MQENLTKKYSLVDLLIIKMEIYDLIRNLDASHNKVDSKNINISVRSII